MDAFTCSVVLWLVSGSVFVCIAIGERKDAAFKFESSELWAITIQFRLSHLCCNVLHSESDGIANNLDKSQFHVLRHASNFGPIDEVCVCPHLYNSICTIAAAMLRGTMPLFGACDFTYMFVVPTQKSGLITGTVRLTSSHNNVGVYTIHHLAEGVNRAGECVRPMYDQNVCALRTNQVISTGTPNVMNE